MIKNNYVLTSDGNFISEEELYHYGVPGMKWGVRKNRDTVGAKSRKARQSSNDSNKTGGKKSVKSTASKKNTKKNTKKKTQSQKDKEDLQRISNALDLHMKAQKISFLNTATGIALRSAGYDRAATLLGEVGNLQVSSYSMASAYDFWR